MTTKIVDLGHGNKSKWRATTEKEYREEFRSTQIFETFTEMANHFSNHVSLFGLGNSDTNAFLALFSTNAAENLCAHLSEQLGKDGKYPVKMITELHKMIIMWLIGSRFHVSTECACKLFTNPQQQSKKVNGTS